MDSLFQAGILEEVDGKISFRDSFLSYFFVGRYLALHLKFNDQIRYDNFVLKAINNIRYRAYANTLLYCVYFSSDLTVLELLIDKLDEKFSSQKKWEISESSFVGLNIEKKILENLQLTNDAREERLKVIDSDVQVSGFRDVEDASNIINPYAPTLKGLLSSDDAEDGNFIGEMNSLFRLQSVVGSALNTRQGTFTGVTILRCTKAIVESAGRFANVNLDIAKSLMANINPAIDIVRDRFPKEDFQYLTPGTNAYEREVNQFVADNIQALVSIHGNWSVISSSCVAGRILAQENTFEALTRLSRVERENSSEINYQIAEGVSKLFFTNKIDTHYYENLMATNARNSFLLNAIGFSIFIFSRFMPIDHKDRQWLSTKFNFRLDVIRKRQRKLLNKHKVE